MAKFLDEKDCESLTSFGSPLPRHMNQKRKLSLKDDLSAIPQNQAHQYLDDSKRIHQDDFSFIGAKTNDELFDTKQGSGGVFGSGETGGAFSGFDYGILSSKKQSSHGKKQEVNPFQEVGYAAQFGNTKPIMRISDSSDRHLILGSKKENKILEMTSDRQFVFRWL